MQDFRSKRGDITANYTIILDVHKYIMDGKTGSGQKKSVMLFVTVIVYCVCGVCVSVGVSVYPN